MDELRDYVVDGIVTLTDLQNRLGEILPGCAVELVDGHPYELVIYTGLSVDDDDTLVVMSNEDR